MSLLGGFTRVVYVYRWETKPQAACLQITLGGQDYVTLAGGPLSTGVH